MIQLHLTSVSLFLIVQGTVGSPLHACPTNRELPDGAEGSLNTNGDQPLYQLIIRNIGDGYTPNEQYTLKVHTTDRRRKFNDVTLSIEVVEATSEPRCDPGHLLVDESLHSPKGCPNVVATTRKQPMGRASFKWQAPACGCVKIRAQVHAEGKYYLDQADSKNGPLVQTVCPLAKYKTKTDRHEKSQKKINILEMSREKRIEHLCAVTETMTLSQAADVVVFLSRRQLSEVSQKQRMMLSIALEQRKLDTDHCCLQGNKRMQCFNHMRRRRIDNYCGTGEPDVPFSSDKAVWMSEKEKECCWKIGEVRYTCFNYTLSVEDMLGDGQGEMMAGERSRVSLDGLDPANDIEDYTGPSSEPGLPLDAKAAEKTGNDGNDENQSVEDNTEEANNGDGEESMELQDFTPALGNERCCLAGITAGTMVSAQGVMGCYKMADQYETLYSNWNKRCDRRFFVCCMQVIYGMSNPASDLTPTLLAPTIGMPVYNDQSGDGSHDRNGRTSDNSGEKSETRSLHDDTDSMGASSESGRNTSSKSSRRTRRRKHMTG